MQYNNEYIKTYLDILSKQNNNISISKHILIEEKRKTIKNKLYKNIILEDAADIECIILFPNENINKDEILKIAKDDEQKEILSKYINTYKTSILKAFNIKEENIGETLAKAFQYSFNKNEFISNLPKDINFLILNQKSNSIAYKASNEQFKAIKNNIKAETILNQYNKKEILKKLYSIQNIKINRNRKKVKNSGSTEDIKELIDFKNNVCKDQYNKIFEPEIAAFTKQYPGNFSKTIDIFNWFHDNFILSSDVYIYKFAKDGSQILKNDILKYNKGTSIKSIQPKLLETIISNNSNEFIYHIESIRDLLNAMIIDGKLDNKKNLNVYKTFQTTIRTKIVDWIQEKITQHEKCSLQTLIEGYEKVQPPILSKEEQIDYNKKAKDILNGFKTFKQKQATQFKALAKTSPDLYNDIKYVLAQSEKPSTNKNLKPYITILKNGNDISKKEYNQLKKLENEFVQIVSNKQAYAEFKKDPDSINNIPEKQQNQAYKKQQNNIEFNKTCKMLGFKDKKKKKGFAALIQRILEGLFSFFGGDDDPTQASSSAIATAMPYVKNHIKAIPPGKYPVYFGNGNISKDEMIKKFQELIK